MPVGDGWQRTLETPPENYRSKVSINKLSRKVKIKEQESCTKLLTEQEPCGIVKMSKKLVLERSVWNERNGHDLQNY